MQAASVSQLFLLIEVPKQESGSKPSASPTMTDPIADTDTRTNGNMIRKNLTGIIFTRPYQYATI